MPDAREVLLSRRAGRAAAVLLAMAVVTSAALARRAVEPDEEPYARLPDAFAGLIRPGNTSTVATPVAVIIAEVMAAVGDELEVNQPIARIDRSRVERELMQLAIEVERAAQDVADGERDIAWLKEAIQRLEGEAADAGAELALAEREVQQVPMRQAKDSPQRAQVAYEQAELRAQRMEQLAADGLVATQDVEDARFSVRIAADDLAIARQAAEAARRVQRAEGAQAAARRQLALAGQRRQLADQVARLQHARLGLKQAQFRYETARLGAADEYVRSPRRGAILDLPVHAGDQLAPGTVVATIASLDPIAVDIDVPPRFVHRLRVGDAALVDVPAIDVSGRSATVRSIAPVPGDDGRYAVRLLVPNPARARLLAGQTAHVTFGGSAPRP